MIIDFHVHTFPDHLAQRAMYVLKQQCGGAPAYTDATLSDTRRKMREWGIDKYVCLNISTNVKQQKNVNDFAINNNGEDCIMFGSVHPFAPDAESELKRIKEAGLKGVKLHCEYQGFDAADKRVYPVYEMIEALGLILVFHGGTDVAFQDTPVRCPPAAVAEIKREFRDLTVVMAHLGGYKEAEQTLEHLAGKDIYLDTSMANVLMTKRDVERILRAHGDEYLLFRAAALGGRRRNCGFIDGIDIPQSKRRAVL